MSAKRKKIKQQELSGLKYFKVLSDILGGLHDAGCDKDRAGNRKLHMDQYMSLLLLYMFNPICSSLRSIQQVSELKKVQSILGCSRASLGSLSDASSVFDSTLMQEIVENLSLKLEPVSGHNEKFNNLTGQLVAIDGTLIPALSKIGWAIWKNDKNAIKAHTTFDIEKHVPLRMTVTNGNANEKEVLRAELEPGRIYVIDRGYAGLRLLQDILNANASFVCRTKDNSAYDILEDYDVSEELKDTIAFDRKIRLGCNKKTKEMLHEPIRLVAIKCNPHKKRYHNARGGPEQGEVLLVATDIFDVDADVIALIYKHRWAVEIFFRFFKHILGCRHLISHSENGIELQMYAAIIACMLISLWTNRKPTLRTYEMLCWYFTGMADEEELMAHIALLQKQD